MSSRVTVLTGLTVLAALELVPKDWDPLKDLRELDFGRLDDADPRASRALDRMREIWDQAPVNAALDGAAVRLPGFVVPLEQTKSGLREFLLVPYFGACIHVPRPPANQIIHVLSDKPIKGVHAMTAVWVERHPEDRARELDHGDERLPDGGAGGRALRGAGRTAVSPQRGNAVAGADQMGTRRTTANRLDFSAKQQTPISRLMETPMRVKSALKMVLYLSSALVLGSCANVGELHSSYSVNGRTFQGMDLRDPHFYMDDDRELAPILSDPRCC